MGLDVYTYTRAEQEAHDAFAARWNEDSDEGNDNPYGKPYGEWTEDEKKAEWAEREALPGPTSTPSQKYPDNINSRRYLRSSYNAGGFNSFVPEVTHNDSFDYYGIFSPLGDLNDYLIKVDDPAKVKECRDRAVTCAAALEKLRGEHVYRADPQRAISLRPQDTDGPMNQEQALRYFHTMRMEHAEKADNSGWDAFGTAQGDFWLGDPLEVVALIPGVDFMGTPCVHAIHRFKMHESYIDSAHVLVEFCDELLDLIAQDGHAYLHWSG